MFNLGMCFEKIYIDRFWDRIKKELESLLVELSLESFS